MNYEIHPEAEHELYEAALHYESGAPGLGHRFADQIDRAIRLLLENPELGSRLDGDLRRFVLRDARNKSFDKLRMNGNLLIPFAVSLSNHEKNRSIQSILREPLIYSAAPAAQGCAAKISGCKPLIL